LLQKILSIFLLLYNQHDKFAIQKIVLFQAEREDVSGFDVLVFLAPEKKFLKKPLGPGG